MLMIQDQSQIGLLPQLKEYPSWQTCQVPASLELNHLLGLQTFWLQVASDKLSYRRMAGK